MSENDIVIRVENLGKQYRLGETLRKPATLGAACKQAALAPFKYLHYRLRAAREEEILWALSDISFEVKKGEAVGVIGRNGAGKSTLLKILSRITDPTEGRAEISGRVNSLLEVGTGFHEELTGRENLYLNAALHGLRKKEIDAKFDEIVDFSGIEQFIDTPVKRYSSGMRVRLGFAVAAHLEPDLLIVDEVLAVGDANFQQKCVRKMDDCKSRGTTILFVSHNMFSIRALCPRAIMLDGGKLVMDDVSSAVVEEYIQVNAEEVESGRLDDSRESLGSGEARFRVIAILDEDGVPRKELYFRGKRISVRIELDVLQPIEEVLLNLNVTTRDGTRLTLSSSREGLGKLLTLKTGMHAMHIELDVDLLPGDYSLAASICPTSGQTIDRVERCFDFTVLRIGRDEQDHYPWEVSHGFIEVHSTWDIKATS